MSARAKGLAVLVVQLLLVLSVAGKYAWERHACPRVWTRATQYDPERPFRGRYLALTLHANACGLGTGGQSDEFAPVRNGGVYGVPAEHWRVRLQARRGVLTGAKAGNEDLGAQDLTLRRDLPCEFATVQGQTEFFIAEHAKTPFLLRSGEELWAEVTVPVTGPPRPVRLAVSDGKQFRVLDFR